MIQILSGGHLHRGLHGVAATLSPKAEEFFSRVRTGEQKVLILEGVIDEAVYVLTKAYGVPREKAASGLLGLSPAAA